jgi:hypothetical protein
MTRKHRSKAQALNCVSIIFSHYLLGDFWLKLSEISPF